MIEKIISGGQTGVDRAALDTAIALGIAHGGWCPKGRLSEKGIIPPHYALIETDSTDYGIRTQLNIRDSDGTLILTSQPLDELPDGTVLTYQKALKIQKPCLMINLSHDHDAALLIHWIEKNALTLLNIAGPRESQSPGIYHSAKTFLEKIISRYPSCFKRGSAF
ncbi:MAG: hypothetical protein K0R12_422 [Gammaproteobacteria bacterium]|jgi:hypothetical protein|nr:hypothetical protein [Gammaproteobacteria bacterium]